ncbi:MAG: hypothetical protein U9R19_15225 [Bacteroidota bacterium]|nr:hypothetical protein [Bacteroidota bacterium]
MNILLLNLLYLQAEKYVLSNAARQHSPTVMSLVFALGLSTYSGLGKSKLELRLWNNPFFSV